MSKRKAWINKRLNTQSFIYNYSFKLLELFSEFAYKLKSTQVFIRFDVLTIFSVKNFFPNESELWQMQQNVFHCSGLAKSANLSEQIWRSLPIKGLLRVLFDYFAL